MPSQEARDAAMAAYEEVVKAQPAEEEPAKPDAKVTEVSTRHRDPSGRWVTQDKAPIVHEEPPAEEGKPAAVEEPPTKPEGKAKDEKPEDDKKAEAKAEDKPPVKDGRKPFKDLTPEEKQARLNDGYEKLTKREAKIQDQAARIEAQRQQIEQERQQLPARTRQEMAQKFRQDPASFLMEMAQEAGLNFRSVYEDHLTPRMLNGGRESAEEIARRAEQKQASWEENWKKQQAEQLRQSQETAAATARASFTNMVMADEDKFPWITGMLEPDEIADAGIEVVPTLRQELGRTPTDLEIAARLDERLRSRYLKSEKLRKLSQGDQGDSTPTGDLGRGNEAGSKAANPEGRKPKTLTNGISAKAATSTRPMTREERRLEALKVPWRAD